MHPPPSVVFRALMKKLFFTWMLRGSTKVVVRAVVDEVHQAKQQKHAKSGPHKP